MNERTTEFEYAPVEPELLLYIDRGTRMKDYIRTGSVVQEFNTDNGVLTRVLARTTPPAGTVYAQKFPVWPWNGIEWIPFQHTGERFPAGAWRLGSIVETATVRGDQMVTERWKMTRMVDALETDPVGTIMTDIYEWIDNLTGGKAFALDNIGIWKLIQRTTAPAYGTSPGTVLQGKLTSRPSSPGGNGNGNGKKNFLPFVILAVIAKMLLF